MRKIGIAILLAVSVSACQDYEHGPLISFKSAEERLVNVWTVSLAENTATNQNLTTNLVAANYRLAIFINGTFGLSWSDTILHELDGDWEFLENETKIDLTFSGTDPIGLLGQNGSTLEILRLKKKELWLRSRSTSLEFQFVPE